MKDQIIEKALSYDRAWGERTQFSVGSWVFNTRAEAQNFINQEKARNEKLKKMLKGKF